MPKLASRVILVFDDIYRDKLEDQILDPLK